MEGGMEGGRLVYGGGRGEKRGWEKGGRWIEAGRLGEDGKDGGRKEYFLYLF